MISQSSPDSLFRFVQLRPPLAIDSDSMVRLIGATSLANAISGAATPQSWQAIADNFVISPGFIRTPEQLTFGTRILDIRSQMDEIETPSLETLAWIAEKTLKLDDLSQLAGDQAFESDRRNLSDSLLARLFTSQWVPNHQALEDAYRVYHVLDRIARQIPVGLEWDEVSTITIALPDWPMRFAVAIAPESDAGIEIAADAQGGTPNIGQFIMDAIKELRGKDEYKNLVQPPPPQEQDKQEKKEEEKPQKEITLYTLTDSAYKSLTQQTRTLLENWNLDYKKRPLHQIILDLLSTLQFYPPPEIIRYVRTPPSSQQASTGLSAGFAAQNTPTVAGRLAQRPAGVAELLVVKQHIKRYEPSEVAHIENLLSGERKNRTHRRLERTEEFFLSEIETTREEEHEMTTAERFELNKETSRTIQQDQHIHFGLSVTGRYGPTIEVKSDFELDVRKAINETSRNATGYARDVVERSLERIVERVREQRTRRIIRETEETNLHELHNQTDKHIRGVYQFLDKVYEAQVFNYGLRQMYDFMVPEPASYLWSLVKDPELRLSQDIPAPVPPLELFVQSALMVTEHNYSVLAALYGAEGIEAPPEPYVVASGAINTERENEGGRPASSKYTVIPIPAGYRARRAVLRAEGVTDNNDMQIRVVVGPAAFLFSRRQDTTHDVRHISLDDEAYTAPRGDTQNPTVNSVVLGAAAFESGNYVVSLHIFCSQTTFSRNTWQVNTYRKIREAYERRVMEYEEKVTALRTKAEEQLSPTEQISTGPPSQNRVVERNELKKHCISILTRQRYENFNATKDDSPPVFDFDQAQQEGSFIRFFEQCFEWDQMQYVFYPYFWSRRTTWRDRFLHDNADAQFREFLKAGAARVVVPVRPGFEAALRYYLDTGRLWDGQGDPPDITNPLYVSIVDEIKDRTGAPKGETPVGDPWEVRLPTSLLLLRRDDELPEWVQDPPGSWQWRPRDAPALLDSDGPHIVRFSLLDATNNTDLVELLDNAEINLATLPPINIRVYTYPDEIGKVAFEINNSASNTAHQPPYKLVPGERTGNQVPQWKPNVGTYTVRARPYTKPDHTMNIREGKAQTIRINVVNKPQK